MIEKESEWIRPEELEMEEKKARSKSEHDPMQDFGSYALLLRGSKDSKIELHNAVGEYAHHFSLHLSYLIKKYKLSHDQIADMGAGAGFIANEVQKLLSGSHITTFELSHNAVLYSQQHFPELTAIQLAISPQSDFNKKFDLIYCKEFYPFTRTQSYSFQKEYIELFLKSLNANGSLVIGALSTPTSIVKNLSVLKADYPQLMVQLQPSRLAFNLIGKISFKLSQGLTQLQNYLLNKQSAFIIIIRK